MDTQRKIPIALCLATLVVYGSAKARSQSAFPLRFDAAPATAATQIESTRAVTISEARHYAKHFSYTVDSMELNKSVAVIEINGTTDDTVVIVRITAAMTKSLDPGIGSLKDFVIKGRYDADTDTWACSSAAGGGFGGGSVSCVLAGTSPLQVQVLGATDELLHLVTVELLASHEVAVSEFAAPL